MEVAELVSQNRQLVLVDSGKERRQELNLRVVVAKLLEHFDATRFLHPVAAFSQPRVDWPDGVELEGDWKPVLLGQREEDSAQQSGSVDR